MTLLALVALLLPAAAAEAKKRPSCKPKHSKTLAVNEAIRVYRISRRKGDEKVTRTYACRLKTRRRIRLSTLKLDSRDPYLAEDGTSAVELRLRGRFLAYALRDINLLRSKTGVIPNPGDRVVRLDITRRHAKRTLGQTPNDTSITDLALTGRGAVAWLTKNDVLPPASYTVALADAGGTRTLAAGTDIAPGSLAMSSSFVYWMRAGSAFARKLTY